MNNNLLTNTLLFIIAVLLLVQVIQNNVYKSMVEKPHLESATQGAYSAAPKQEASIPMGTEMIFHAMKAFPEGCSGKLILAQCDSPAALKVKNQIQVWADDGKPIRALFDQIVKTFGEEVLTDEARQIRQQSRSNK